MLSAELANLFLRARRHTLDSRQGHRRDDEFHRGPQPSRRCAFAPPRAFPLRSPRAFPTLPPAFRGNRPSPSKNDSPTAPSLPSRPDPTQDLAAVPTREGKMRRAGQLAKIVLDEFTGVLKMVPYGIRSRCHAQVAPDAGPAGGRRQHRARRPVRDARAVMDIYLPRGVSTTMPRAPSPRPSRDRSESPPPPPRDGQARWPSSTARVGGRSGSCAHGVQARGRGRGDVRRHVHPLPKGRADTMWPRSARYHGTSRTSTGCAQRATLPAQRGGAHMLHGAPQVRGRRTSRHHGVLRR